MNRRRLVALIAAASVVSCVGMTYRASQRFARPFPPWMVDADQWYDHALGAAMYGVVAGACVVYLYRQSRRERRATSDQVTARPARWRDKVELRFALHCLAALLVLQFPLGVVKAVRALNDARPPWKDSLWSLVPAMSLIGPPIGVAIVLYDRRRIRRETREDAGACLNCGYDLRATPARCPECGTVPT